MDPIVFIFTELHDMVFQHFSAADFQEVTKVSPSWNETIGNSLVLMRKVKVMIDELYNDDRLLETIKRVNTTTRRYQNVRIERFLQTTPEILKYFLTPRQTLLELEIRSPPFKLSVEKLKYLDEVDLSGY